MIWHFWGDAMVVETTTIMSTQKRLIPRHPIRTFAVAVYVYVACVIQNLHI